MLAVHGLLILMSLQFSKMVISVLAFSVSKGRITRFKQTLLKGLKTRLCVGLSRSLTHSLR